MRKQINEISSVKMWDGRYEEISAKAQLLSDPAQLDEMMKTERGMLQFEQMAKQINDEITLAEDEWARLTEALMTNHCSDLRGQAPERYGSRRERIRGLRI